MMAELSGSQSRQSFDLNKVELEIGRFCPHDWDGRYSTPLVGTR